MDKVVEVVSGGPVITGPTPSSFSVRQTYLCGSRKPFKNNSKIIQIKKNHVLSCILSHYYSSVFHSRTLHYNILYFLSKCL